MRRAARLTDAHGAALPGPVGLFNTGPGSGTRRAIDIPEDGTPVPAALQALVRAAIAFNLAHARLAKG